MALDGHRKNSNSLQADDDRRKNIPAGSATSTMMYPYGPQRTEIMGEIVHLLNYQKQTFFWTYLSVDRLQRASLLIAISFYSSHRLLIYVGRGLWLRYVGCILHYRIIILFTIYQINSRSQRKLVTSSKKGISATGYHAAQVHVRDGQNIFADGQMDVTNALQPTMMTSVFDDAETFPAFLIVACWPSPSNHLAHHWNHSGMQFQMTLMTY